MADEFVEKHGYHRMKKKSYDVKFTMRPVTSDARRTVEFELDFRFIAF